MKLKLSCSYELSPKQATCNTAYVQGTFGIGFETGRNVIARNVEVDYGPGKIVLFSGPSGSGKSSLLRAATAQIPGATWLDEAGGGEAALIDALGIDAKAAAHTLSLCGLGEAFLMLRSPGELSDGQRYRFALARALAGGAETIAADEWCAKLDRVTAKVISHNVRKVSSRRGVGFLLATTHEDLIDDLSPDVIVRCGGFGVVEVEKRRPFRREVSFHRQLDITEGAASDWPFFARWHYRGHGLGPVRRVMVLWHGAAPVGICVFGFGPLSSAARNRVFGLTGPVTRARAKLINRNFACVSRLVLDPRYRGAGLAGAFLDRCCEMVRWPWIELVSEMGALVPFGRRAGFRRIGSASQAGSRARRRRRRDKSATAWGASGWTPEGFAAYARRSRFSRPAYFLRDNRAGGAVQNRAKPQAVQTR